jgi:predicted TIM-barrel fold metal-dependent hydrolase
MPPPDKPISRRKFFATSGLAALSLTACQTPRLLSEPAPDPIIDIHQHTHYHGRSDHDLIRHQKIMGATTTVLLPAGLYYGLDALCGRNDTCYALAKKYPNTFRFFANEMPYLKEAADVIVQYLKKGAIGIGEQKFRITADSLYMDRIAGIAGDYHVPILLHFQDTDYNMEFNRFYKTLEKFPNVTFIGHAQTWWGNISQGHDSRILYPKGPVTPGGITDKLLSDYPNIFGDLSAGSGLNALIRDPEHTRAFLARHQDKLLFGSDCEDTFGAGEKCTGAQAIQAVRQYAPDKAAERKMLYANANRLLKLNLA